MAKHPVTIQRQKDGRHAVLDSDGNVLGKHNSVWSAARQVHEYVTPAGSPDIHPPVPRPDMPRPARTQAPKPNTPRIPRP